MQAWQLWGILALLVKESVEGGMHVLVQMKARLDVIAGECMVLHN